MNKYEKWYQNITKRGQTRKLDSYTESHHIIPTCLNGPDTLENKTDLTAQEHFICHWLLTKIYTTGKERYLVLNALQGMRRENKHQKRYHTKITSRVYANLKEEWSKLSSERMKGENNPAKKTEVGKKISDSKTGKKREPFTEEWLANIKSARQGEKNGMFNKKHSDETKQLQREKAIGRKYSAEVNASKGRPGLRREKKHCVHCNKEVAVNGYARWHGDNCKLNPANRSSK